MKIYLSGAMSNIPDWNYANFNRVARQLREQGYDVVNPAELGNSEWDWETNMKRVVKEIPDCDAIVCLDGWQQSRGANVEVYVGIVMGLDVYDERMSKIEAKDMINRKTIMEFMN